MTFSQILEERLLQILTNDEEVQTTLVETIATEALEIVGDRDLKQPFILDLAIYRYLLVKGDMQTEAYEKSYLAAMKKLDKAPAKIDDDTEIVASDIGITVGQRSGAWM